VIVENTFKTKRFGGGWLLYYLL